VAYYKCAGGRPPQKTTMKRKNCETNWAELVAALGFCEPTIETFEQVKGCELGKLNPNYVADLEGRKPKMVESYLKTLKVQIATHDFPEIERVVVLGKKQRIDSEISKLQEGLDRKETKADVMVKFVTGEWIGVSVKASPKATMTNYSVEKILSDGKELGLVRKQVLKSSGLPTDTMEKERRSEYNACFKVENKYFQEVDKSIQSQKKEILEIWASSMFPKTPFRMYLFNGESLKRIDGGIDISKISFTKTTNPAKKPRGAAKMFYSVNVEGVESYRWEIRWKGSTLCSPQIQTHAVH